VIAFENPTWAVGCGSSQLGDMVFFVLNPVWCPKKMIHVNDGQVQLRRQQLRQGGFTPTWATNNHNALHV